MIVVGKAGHKKHPNLAIELMEQGAALVLHPELKLPNSRKLTLKMRLRLADGTFIEGKWNYAKRRLESMARLTEGKSEEGWKQWTLKSNSTQQ